MAKKFNIRAPKSVKLHEMNEREIQAMVRKEAERMLDNLPKDYRPIGVNAVTVESLVPGSNQDPGVWAQWERACCGSRNKIEDFTDPVIQEIEPGDTAMNPQLLQTHFESQMRIINLENPEMHR